MVGGIRPAAIAYDSSIGVVLICFIVWMRLVSVMRSRCTDRLRQGIGQTLRRTGSPKTVNHHRMAQGFPNGMVHDIQTDCTGFSHRFLRSCTGAEAFGHWFCQHGASCCGCDRIGHVLFAIPSGRRPWHSIRAASIHLRSAG